MGIIKSQLNHKCPPRKDNPNHLKPLLSHQELLPNKHLLPSKLLPLRLPRQRRLLLVHQTASLRTSSRSRRETPSSSSTSLISVLLLRPLALLPAQPLPPQPLSMPPSTPLLTRSSSMLSVLPRRTATSMLKPRPRLLSSSGPEVSTSSHPSPRRSCSSS